MLSGIVVALTSTCVITSTTFAHTQSIQKVSTLSMFANKIFNRGAVSYKPHKAVKEAYTLWNNLSKEKGYKKFKVAKNPKVVLTLSYPLQAPPGKVPGKQMYSPFPVNIFLSSDVQCRQLSILLLSVV